MAFGGRGGYGGGGGGNGGKVCQFYLRGDCKFGDKCRYIHPLGREGAERQDRNPFAALSGHQSGPQGGGGGRSQFPRGGASGGFRNERGSHRGVQDYGVTEEDIQADLTVERPIWLFSCYGPGRDAPAELITSDREESAEEMRVKHYIDPNAAQEHANQLLQLIEQQRQAILNDVRGAIRHIEDAGRSQDPAINRTLLVQHPTATWKNPERNQMSSYQWHAPQNNVSMGQSQPSHQTAFGQPSAPTSGSGAVPAPSFGQPTQSSFGAPSQLGSAASTQPAFGQPSGSSGLGGGTFGRPSSFSSSAQQLTGPAAQGTSFGQPSLGQPSFGQPSFGQPSQPNQSSAFGSAKPASPFASSNQPTHRPSPFAAAGGFGQQSQPQQRQSPFASGSNNVSTGFGQPSQPQSQSNGSGSGGFSGQSLTAQSSHTGFGAFGAQQSQHSTGFGTSRQEGSAPTPFDQPNLSMYTQKAGNNLASWKGRDVAYVEAVSNTDCPPSDDLKVRKTQKIKRVPVYQRPDDGSEERIWFPNGPEGVLSETPGTKSKLQADAEAPTEVYKSELGGILKGIYASAWEEGKFNNGVMPEVPPELGWVRYDI